MIGPETPLGQSFTYTFVARGPAVGMSTLTTIHTDQVGTWAWHCHILTHAENASGMVTALVVQ
jgi:hypothetical protein